MSSLNGGGSVYGGGGSVNENSTVASFSSRNSVTNSKNKLENLKINGTLDLLRKEISLSANSTKNENIVMKEEKIEVNGKEINVHRVYMLYGAYRIGWILDEDIQSCMECQVEFNFLTRRHHCRACGNIICSNCSPYKATIPTLDELNGSRVCVNCFGLKVNLNNLRHYSNLEEFDSFETISSQSDDHGSGSVYSGGMIHVSSSNAPGISPIERDLRQQEQLQHKREQKALSRQKLIEASRKPQYLRAYRTMRAIVPPDISETNLQAMLRAGLPRPVAERIWKCRCLWLLSMHPDDIKKIHIADFRSKYAPVGLDLTELRAVWHCLPEWSLKDEKEKEKAEWKINLKIQLDDMVRKDEKGELCEEHRRNEAYLGYEPIRVYSSAPTNISRRYSGIELETSDLDNPSDDSIKMPSSSYCTPPRQQQSSSRAPRNSVSLLNDDLSHRRHSFSDADSMSPQTPSPYKTADRMKHRPNIYHSPTSTHSPPISLFLYRQTSGDLASTEDRGKTFSLPPEMHKDDLNWIDRFREFFLGSDTTPRAAVNLTKTQSEPLPREDPSGARPPLQMKRHRSATENNRLVNHQSSSLSAGQAVAAAGSSSNGGGMSQYRMRREEEKKLNQRSASNSPSRSPFPTRARSQSERIPREKLIDSPSTVEKLTPIPYPITLPVTGSPCSSQDSPGKNSDNCTPVRTRVPFFSSEESPPPSVSTTLSPPRSPPRNSLTKVSSNTSTMMTPQPSKPKRSAPKPPLSATPLRDMMASLSPSAMVQKLRESDLRVSSSEATDLLKYLLVNYGDLNSEFLLPEHDLLTKPLVQIEREEKSLLQTLSILIQRCGANVNSLDRDGNSLLTFIIQYNSLSPSSSQEPLDEDKMRLYQRGIRQLISSLVFHGIQLFISPSPPHTVSSSSDGSVVTNLHEAFLQLSHEEKIELIEKFIEVEVSSEDQEEEGGDQVEGGLNPNQLFNYCVVLILIGRIKYASQLMTTHSILLTSSQASVLLKSCQFDLMENPVEAFELLDKFGAQL